MSRIPAVSIYGDSVSGERAVVAVDLDRVDARIRVDVVRELALGSSPAPEWSKQSRLHKIERPEQLRAVAAEEQRRQATRADLAGYMGPELPGRYTAGMGEVADRFEVLPNGVSVTRSSTSAVEAPTEVPGSRGRRINESTRPSD